MNQGRISKNMHRLFVCLVGASQSFYITWRAKKLQLPCYSCAEPLNYAQYALVMFWSPVTEFYQIRIRWIRCSFPSHVKTYRCPDKRSSLIFIKNSNIFFKILLLHKSIFLSNEYGCIFQFWTMTSRIYVTEGKILATCSTRQFKSEAALCLSLP